MPKPKPKKLGDRIRLLREDRNMTRDELALEVGCSLEYLEWVEENQTFPPVALLIQLARALRVETGTFLAPEGSPEKRLEASSKRSDNYLYENLSPKASDKHLKPFMITLGPQHTHEGVGYSHEGEEFAYVLEGEVVYNVGENRNVLGPGETIHFNSTISHELTNEGEEEAKLLVILYVP